MSNWFYMDLMTFENLLNDELGSNLTKKLLLLDFDRPVSFMIGETSDEILTKIQQAFSRKICRKFICNDDCILCSLNPSTYAKLAWFVQRLLIMSPIRKPFIKQTSLSNEHLSSMKDKKVTLNVATSCDFTEQNVSNVNINKNDTEKSVQSKNSDDKCLDCERLTIIIFFMVFVIVFMIFLGCFH